MSVRPAKTQISLGIAQSDQSLRWPYEETLGNKLAIERKRRLWSDWVDAQADLSLRWAHSHFAGFDMRRLRFSHDRASL